MKSDKDAFNPILLNVVPLGYYYYTRLKFYCRKFPCHILVLLWETSLFLIPTLWFYYSTNGINYTDILIISFSTLLLYTIYELGYLVNDTITDKRDTMPRNRPATRALNKPVFIAIRIFMISVLYRVLSNYVNQTNLLLAFIFLIYGIIVHNLTFNKAYRYATFTILRLGKYLFVPIIFFGKTIIIYYIIIILIPTLIHDVLHDYGYRYLIHEDVRFPRHIKYGVFVPMIILLVGVENLPAYIHLIILSLVPRRNK